MPFGLAKWESDKNGLIFIEVLSIIELLSWYSLFSSKYKTNMFSTENAQQAGSMQGLVSFDLQYEICSRYIKLTSEQLLQREL
jgi:hypothetical protein